MAHASQPLVLAVSGPKNAGKTHLLEHLIQALAAKPLRFAVAKHDPHAHMKMDHEGKDSWRYAAAGSQRVAVVSPLGLAVIDRTRSFSAESSPVEMLTAVFPQVDLILAEGFKDHRLPRIKLLPAEGRPADRVVLSGDPVMDRECGEDDAEALSLDRCIGFIEEQLQKRQLGGE